MNNSGNQIRNRMISRNPITDTAKLAGLERFIHEQYPEVTVTLQPYLLFTKGEDEYVGWRAELTQRMVEMYRIFHSDMILVIPDKDDLIFELDGAIHDTKRSNRTEIRNDLYQMNDIPYIVINEANLKYDLGVKPSNKLSQNQINAEFQRRYEDV